MGRHYLFPMWEGGGNVPPILGVARRLIERGHTVTVLGDPTIQVEAEQFGCRFLPWRRAPHRTTLRPEDDLLRDWETKNPFQMLRHYRDRFITEPAPAYAADTLDAIDATSPDLVVPEYRAGPSARVVLYSVHSGRTGPSVIRCQQLHSVQRCAMDDIGAGLRDRAPVTRSELLLGRVGS